MAERFTPRHEDTGRFMSHRLHKEMVMGEAYKENRDKDLIDATKKASEAVVKEVGELNQNFQKQKESLIRRDKLLADANSRLIKENSKFFSKRAGDFMGQAKDINNELAVKELSSTLRNHVQSMESISERAATANFKELQSLKLEAISKLQILQTLSDQEEDQEQMRELIKISKEQVKMLSQETNLLNRMAHGIGDLAKTGLGAAAGVLSDSPIVAMGIQFIQSQFEKRREDQRNMTMEQLDAIKEQQEELRSGLSGMGESIGDEIGENLVEILDNKLAEFLPDDTTESEREELMVGIQEGFGDFAEILRSQEDGQDDNLEVLEELANTGDATHQLFERWLNGTEEERREELNRHNKMLNAMKEQTAAKDEKEGKGLTDFLQNIGLLRLAGGAGIFGAIIGLIMGAVNMVFRGIGFLIRKGLPAAMIGISLFEGIREGAEEYRKSGDMQEAVKQMFGSVAEAMTFGLLPKDKLFKWGGQLGLSLENTIYEFSLALEEEFHKAFDPILNTIDRIGSMLNTFGSNFVDEFKRKLPPGIRNLLTDINVLDTKHENEIEDLAKKFDERIEEKLRIAATTKDAHGRESVIPADFKFLLEENERKLEDQAEKVGITVDELKAEKQKTFLEQNPNASGSETNTDRRQRFRESRARAREQYDPTKGAAEVLGLDTPRRRSMAATGVTPAAAPPIENVLDFASGIKIPDFDFGGQLAGLSIPRIDLSQIRGMFDNIPKSEGLEKMLNEMDAMNQQAADMAKAEQRKVDAVRQASTVNNTNIGGSTQISQNIDFDKTFNADPTFLRSQDINHVG